MHRPIVATLLSVLLAYESANAQSTSVLTSVTFTRTITGMGLGEQGAALRDPFDALVYNPANLIYARSAAGSFFRDPWYFFDWTFPFSSVAFTAPFASGGGIGVEYTNWRLSPPGLSSTGKFMTAYERSAALGVAFPLNEDLAVGAQFRYAWSSLPFTYNDPSPISTSAVAHNMLIGLGASYTPSALDDKVTFGLSFMNFGSTVVYEPETAVQDQGGSSNVPGDPPPSQIRLGLEWSAVAAPSFDLFVAMEAVKPLDMIADASGFRARTSLQSLVEDWDDFPEDVTAHLGIGWHWRPLQLGQGVAYVQEMDLGYFSTGPRDLQKSMLTHSLSAGLQVSTVRATIGYAGRWHNYSADRYITRNLPWEMFQLRVSVQPTSGDDASAVSVTGLQQIIVSAGIERGFPVGRMKEISYGPATSSYTFRSMTSATASFYLEGSTALVSTLRHAVLTQHSSINFGPMLSPYVFDLDIETLSFESGIRYHPFEEFSPLFSQVSLGVIGMKPIHGNVTPKYTYKSTVTASVGFLVPLLPQLYVTPTAGVRMMLLEIDPADKLLGGFDQFEVGISVGYAL